MNRDKLKKIVINIVTFATILLILYFLYIKRSMVLNSIESHPYYFTFLWLLYILCRVLDGLNLKIIFKSMGLILKTEEWLGLPILTFFYSFAVPNAGLVTNALYLKSKHKFHISDYLSIGIMRTLTQVLVSIVIGLAFTLLILRHNYRFLNELLVIYISGMIFIAAVYILSWLKAYEKISAHPKIVKILSTVRTLLADKKLFWKLFVIQFFMLLAFSSRYYVIFKMLNSSPSFSRVLSMVPIVDLSQVVSILPSNLGIKEFMTTIGAKIIDYPLETGLFVAVIDRLVTLIGNFVSGVYFFFKLKYSESI